jgi:DNA repair protein RadA/Sms
MGLFEMREDGLREVGNPSNLFLSQYGDASVGSVVVATVEGSRPLLVEIQALTAPAGFGPPRRVANGIDFNRLLLVVSVLARRAGLKLFNQDVLVNVTGGLKIGETAVDLGIVLSVASSFLDRKPLDRLVAIGEIGLSGEIRQVPQMERRIAEAARLGFKNVLVPALATVVPTGGEEGFRLLKASTVKEALSQAFVVEGKRG